MHSRNDVPPHSNNDCGGGVEGPYVPFSSSGGARPLPYPFRLYGKAHRRPYGKKEKEEPAAPEASVALVALAAVAPAAEKMMMTSAPLPSPTDRHLADELARGLKKKRGERRTGGRGRRSLKTLLAVLGDEKAVWSLIQLKGGTLLDIPLGKNEKGRRAVRHFEEVLGKQAAQNLITYAGGTKLYIPRAAYLETDKRNRDLCLERDSMAKNILT